MVVNVVTIIALLLLFLGVILVFNARWIVKNKMKSNNENKTVTILKIVGFVVIVISLLLICYFK